MRPTAPYTLRDTSEGVRVETVPAEGKRPLAAIVEVTTRNAPGGALNGRVQLYRIIDYPAGGVFVVWSDLGIARNPDATRRAFAALSSSIELR